ncbi:MAG: RtcB family protein [Acidimicrobiia bacterium]|nr:RtcB family protein [Acidimicrobiia bacterium]MDH5295317.1 RtcB family protein [Acidimicrobiia bacterium]
MQVINDKLKSWADDLDAQTLAQAQRTARLPIVIGHVALMPDAHLGLGATVGSVVPTEGAVIPACVGVDIGCGMAAVRTDLTAGDLPDDLGPLLRQIERVIPAGVGQGHDRRPADNWLEAHRPRTELDSKLEKKAHLQMGTLGSGNHFAEISLDEDDRVWVVIHSGSRGIGNLLAQSHIAEAKAVAKRLQIGLEDPDLAYLLEGTPEFEHYIADLRFAQGYARQNRDTMLDALLRVFFRFVGRGRERERVNCHHNYTEQETHRGRILWVTRKGAISARAGELGILPGSMGTDSYITEGLGNPESYHSSAHGAGRRMSRTQARKRLSTESLADAMKGRTWLSDRARSLVDEHPDAYKDINEVMRLSADLVKVRHRLVAVLNYKGT